jgi:hypothetical protein
MKRIIIFSAVLFVFTAFTTEAKRFNNMSGYFYSELSPYGQWIEIDYGVVVWQPTIMQTGWAPYSQGRWVWTYDGWYWDSYESFGYVTYHYGRWYHDDYYGWLWYPDYEWAPAWVEWRYSNDYIGWAPLHPYASFSISIGIHFSNVFHTPYHHWHFIGYNNFCHQYPYNYYVAPNHRYRVYSNTTYRTNYGYRNGRVQNRGIDIDYVRVRSGQDIRQREITRVRDPQQIRGNHGNRNEIRTLDVSRDQLSRNDNRNMNVKQDRRRTSLDVNRVEIGDRNRNNTVTRNDNRQKTVNRNDVKNKRTDKTTVNKKRTQTDVKRNDVNTNKNNRNDRNTVNKKRTDQKNTVNRNQNQVNTNKNNRNDRNVVNQNKTVKKNNENRNQNQVNRNNNNTRNDRNIVKQNKTVKKNNVNRNQNQVKNNTNKKRTTDVKRNNTRTTTTKKNKTVKKDNRSTNNNNTNRNRKR